MYWRQCTAIRHYAIDIGWRYSQKVANEYEEDEELENNRLIQI